MKKSLKRTLNTRSNIVTFNKTNSTKLTISYFKIVIQTSNII